MIFLLPYLLMYAAVAILRHKDPDRVRPFKIPGGDRVVAMALVTSPITAGGVLLFLWREIPGTPKDWSYTGPLLAIVGVTLVAGEAMPWRIGQPRGSRRSAVAIEQPLSLPAGVP